MLLYASIKSTEDKLPFESTATTLGNYTAVFTSPATLPIFLNTLLFTAGSLAIGLPLAIILAWLVERTAIPGRAWIGNLILVPMTVPSLLSAIAWVQLLDPRNGLVNVVLRGVFGLQSDTGPFDIYTLSGMCFVQGLQAGAFGVFDDRGIVSRHGPIVGRAKRDGGAERRANHTARDVCRSFGRRCLLR